MFDRRKDWAGIEELVHFGKVDFPEVVSWIRDIAGPDDQRLVPLAAIVTDVAS